MVRRASQAYAAGFALLSLLLAHTLFVVPYLPTNDGPEHVLAAHMEAHYGDPGTLYSEMLLPAPEFASRGFAFVFAPLADLFGWRVGLQLSLVVIALATAWGFVALVAALEPRRLGVAFLGFPLALSWGLYMGFFPFAVGSALGLFVLALALAWREPTPLHRSLVAVLLLLQGVCHVFSAALTGAVLALALVARRTTRADRVRELGKVALMGLPAACLLLVTARSGGAYKDIPFAHDFLMLPASLTAAVFPRFIAPGPWWRAVATAAILAAASVAATLRLTKGASPLERALFGGGVVLLLAGALSPLHIPGWQFFSPRFVPLGVLLCLASAPVENATPRAAFAVVTSLFAFSIVSLLASERLHRRLVASSADAIAGLSAPVKRHAIWLPVGLAPQGGLPFDPSISEVPFLAPLRHISALYAVTDGGMTPYTFAINSASYPFTVRPDAPRLPPVPGLEPYAIRMESDAFDHDLRVRHGVEDELATYGMFYEGVLVTEAHPDDLALWRARGYVADWEGGSVLIAHFSPCVLDLALAGSGPAPLVDVGVGEQTILRDEAGVVRVDADGSRRLSLARAPCGEVWVRPHWREGEAPAFCKNASRGGTLLATLSRTSGPVECVQGAAAPPP